MASLRFWIWLLSWLPSLVVTEAAMTGRDTPHARPREALDVTNTYGTFCGSAKVALCLVGPPVGRGVGRRGVEGTRGHHQHRCIAHLVLCQQRQVQDNLNGLRISCHDDELRDAAVQRLGGCMRMINSVSRLAAA